MRVKNLITGVESTERADIAQALIRQGMCERVNDGSVTPAGEDSFRLPRPGDFVMPAPKWCVTETPLAYCAISFELLGNRIFYTGRPDLISPRAFLGREAPKEILEQYKQAYRVPAKRDLHAAAQQEMILAGGPGPNPENQRMARDAKEAEEKERRRALEFVPENPDKSLVFRLWENIWKG
jgi:hypothetical protein